MNEPPDSNLSQHDNDRLMRIESALAHLQQDIDTLNQSLLDYLRKIQGFESRCTRIESAIRDFSESPEQRDPELEQPPHY